RRGTLPSARRGAGNGAGVVHRPTGDAELLAGLVACFAFCFRQIFRKLFPATATPLPLLRLVLQLLPQRRRWSCPRRRPPCRRGRGPCRRQGWLVANFPPSLSAPCARAPALASASPWPARRTAPASARRPSPSE